MTHVDCKDGHSSCDEADDGVFVCWISLSVYAYSDDHDGDEFTALREDESQVVYVCQRCVAERRRHRACDCYE